MTRYDIIRMAEQSQMNLCWGDVVFTGTSNLERFAALAAEWGAKQEREACAKVCEALGNDASIDDLAYEAFREADEAIRARGEGKS